MRGTDVHFNGKNTGLYKVPVIIDLLAYRMKTYLAILYFYSVIYFLL